jgi:hypothetical protein
MEGFAAGVLEAIGMAEERWVNFGVGRRRGGDGPEKATRLGDFGGDGRLQLSSVAVGFPFPPRFSPARNFRAFFSFFALILIILCCYVPIIFDIFPN